LRTNFTFYIPKERLKTVARAFHQVVVSVDGNEKTHDERRGKGSYQIVVNSIKRYYDISSDIPQAGELSLACVMSSDDINGEPGQSVRDLAKRFEIRRIRFRPLLPLGRAADWGVPVICEGLLQYISSEEMLESEFHPLRTCGIGQNVYVEPDGNVYPCYAWHKPHTIIGNLATTELSVLLNSDAFTRLSRCSVDTIHKCKECEYRYLCGGACRAWGDEKTQQDISAAPLRCDHLKSRANNLIDAAKRYLLLT
jgi:uncharacterized protein